MNRREVRKKMQKFKPGQTVYYEDLFQDGGTIVSGIVDRYDGDQVWFTRNSWMPRRLLGATPERAHALRLIEEERK